MATTTIYTGSNSSGTAYDDTFILDDRSFYSEFRNAFVDGGGGYDVVQIADYLDNWWGDINPNQTSTIGIQKVGGLYNTLYDYAFTLRGIEELAFIDYWVAVDDPPSNPTPEPEESIAGGLILNIESAEHLYRVNGNRKTIPYYIDKKGGAGKAIGLDDPAKMIKAEENHIVNDLKTLSKYTGLTFKRTKNWDDSAFDIFKVNSFKRQDLLGYMTQTDFGNAMVFREDSDQNEEKQTITHEIGHGVGLSHPYQEPSNPKYDTRNTVMSYNSALNSNGTTWVGGYRPDDIAAAKYLWSDGVKDTGKYKPASDNGVTFSKADTERMIDDFHRPTFTIQGRREQLDFGKYWTRNSENFLSVFKENLLNQYTGIVFEAGKRRLDFDASQFTGQSPDHPDFHGFIEIIGNDKNNTFKARGPELYSRINGEAIILRDLVIDGGAGEDTVVIPNGFDFEDISTFVGFGLRGREITFSGSKQQVQKSSGKIINADYEQGLTLFETVEYIKIDDETYTFDALYSMVDSGSI